MEFHLTQGRRFLEEQHLDGLILVSKENKYYTAGLYSGSGSVFITKQRFYVIVDGRYYTQQMNLVNKTTLPPGAEVMVLLADETCGSNQWIRKIARQEGIKRLGFEKDSMTFGQYEMLRGVLEAELTGESTAAAAGEPMAAAGEPMAAAGEPRIALVPVSPARIRMIKDSREISCITAACEITDNGFRYILTKIRPGMTEIQVENHLLSYLKRIGARKEAFDIIVASGANGANPHAKASEKVIEAGDFVTLDFGVRVGEYCSDLTRTVAVSYARGELVQIYEIVRNAQAAAIQAIKPGKTCGEIDMIARDLIIRAGYGNKFSHNLGHGLGIACHEEPNFSGWDKTILLPGMVMTVEPGIYVEGLGGIRIEDDILVTEEGCRVLTVSPKELTVVAKS